MDVLIVPVPKMEESEVYVELVERNEDDLRRGLLLCWGVGLGDLSLPLLNHLKIWPLSLFWTVLVAAVL